jgi:transposase-like protein
MNLKSSPTSSPSPMNLPPLPWDRDLATEVVTQLERSGMSVAAFAAQQGVPAHHLYRWRRELARTPGTTTPAVVPVHVVQAPQRHAIGSKPEMVIELVTPGGCTLRMRHIEARQLAEVLRAVGEIQC